MHCSRDCDRNPGRLDDIQYKSMAKSSVSYVWIEDRYLLNKKMKSKIQPPAYFFICLLLSIGLHFALPVTRVVVSPYRFLGIVLIGFGVVFNLWTDSLFKKHKTTVKPYENPTHLEVVGPFCISRHPMYLGMLSVLLGIAVALGSLLTFVFPILFVMVVEVMFIPFEEKNLEEVFGKQYRDYKKKVRRWI